MWSAVDKEGRPRILYGSSSLRVDIGAYEYWPKELAQCHTQRAEMNHATDTFFVAVSVTGLACPSPRAPSIWLVVTDIVFAVPGPKSEARLWNADGIASERYLGSGDYYFRWTFDWCQAA